MRQKSIMPFLQIALIFCRYLCGAIKMYDFYAVARKTERQAHNSRVGFGSEITEPRKVQCPKSWGIVTGSAGPFATFRFFSHRT